MKIAYLDVTRGSTGAQLLSALAALGVGAGAGGKSSPRLASVLRRLRDRSAGPRREAAALCRAIERLGADRIIASPIPLGPRTDASTLALFKGWPVFGSEACVDPVTAAVLTVYARPGPLPSMTLDVVGTGGDVRILVGTAQDPETSDLAWLVETNLDNVPGDLVGYLFERLFDAGALDVFAAPIQMKKSRPAVTVSAIVPPHRLKAVEEIFLRETPTFGIRRTLLERSKLAREERVVRTPYGPIRVKLGRLSGRVVKSAPEYEDVRSAARRRGVPLSVVHQAALKASDKY